MKMSWEDAVKFHCKNSSDKTFVKDCYFDDDVFDAALRYVKSEEWFEISEILKPYNGRALDFGAGRGIASYALQKAGFNVFALEPDDGSFVGRGAIQDLNTKAKTRIQIVDGITEKLPFDDNFFDVIFGRAVLHHMQDLSLAMTELNRVLKPTGLIIATREHVISKDADLQSFLETHPLHRFYGGEHAYTLKHYISVFKASGFRVQKLIKPLRSNINTAPKTTESIVIEIINRIIPNNTDIKNILLRFKKKQFFKNLVIYSAEIFDNRPGRLYSFVLRKSNK